MGKLIKTLARAGMLAAAVALAGVWGARPAAAEELRIGFVAPITGIFAQVGKDMVNGFQMYLDEHHGILGGATVKFIVEDEQGKPDVAVQKAEKLIRQDHVQMFLGGLLASTGYALAPVSTREKVIYISTIAAADDLTQRQKGQFPYFMRTAWSSSQPSHPFGQWACDQGYKKVVIVAADYAFGYEAAGGFQQAFEDCGGKIIQKIFPPLGTIDFGPYLPQIKGDADAVFTVMVGPMVLQFPKQYKAAGLSKPLIGAGTSADEFSLPFMGDYAIGYTTPLQYSAALETPKNEAFVKRYRALYGKVPSYYSESNYSTAEWIGIAMAKSGGKWPGTEQFIKTFSGIQLDSVRGPVRLDQYMNPVENIYIRKVEKKKMFGYPNEELWNTITKTYPNVSQFGQYKPDEYMKLPLYSRDVPACRYCE